MLLPVPKYVANMKSLHMAPIKKPAEFNKHFTIDNNIMTVL